MGEAREVMHVCRQWSGIDQRSQRRWRDRERSSGRSEENNGGYSIGNVISLNYRQNTTPTATENFDLFELGLTDERRQIRLPQPST